MLNSPAFELNGVTGLISTGLLLCTVLYQFAVQKRTFVRLPFGRLSLKTTVQMSSTLALA
jgi:hypothetical protein